MLAFVIVAILLAFVFTYTNGFQIASSVGASFIASRSALPRQGILFIAAMMVLGALLGGSAVAFTISGLLLMEPSDQLVLVVLAALIGATGSNLLTWKFALPSSSTHALIGGLIGAGLAAAGHESIAWGLRDLLVAPHELTGLVKVLVFLILSVVIGLIGGYALHRWVKFLLRNAKRSVNDSLVNLNWIAAGIMAFASGANASQKQLGIIALVIFAAGFSAAPGIPFSARLVCALMLGLGTLTGGWRIMTTLGRKLFRLEPIHSFNSQLSSGVSIALSTFLGAPVSPTQVISLSLIGVGSAENPRKIQWSVGKDIVASFLIIIPATMIVSGVIYLVIGAWTGR
ncbi:MAG TPA: inorganic phosphate transporter [Methanoregulaceae archaeon]|nr:MAG: inorganic phosphate transporter [Methanolinea sp.]HON82387.1 inorganic phosphate transporter [Methanoregulaceae archaeon]HPD10094.1 inorganic phosphate transporter [Methanoregulaceae archaeon]HRT15100.1 inorganic phosphate transporter [Methanoregulaceae archaeon]HRU30671.1 inorganic phosphate transporter [Methanoregulaceae archaeon]